MKQNERDNYTESGFTIIEVMIALLISGLVIAAVYSAFRSQQDSYLAQEQVVEMQQNIRAGVDLMAREIRAAGYDPSQNANAGVTVATVGQFAFTKDDNEDGDVLGSGEAITFGFSLDNDANGDGIVDDLNGDTIQNDVAPLARNSGSGFQPIAENIQAVEFYYILANGTATTAPAIVANVRSVQVTVLARAGNADRKFINTQMYTTPSGASWGPFGDNFRRRLVTIHVKCRNMGL